MPLRLFGGGSSGRTRTCPACEQTVAAEATFCPACYMVFRPEGAADLREHLRGGRVPGDVYLLRRMQVEDPNTGPVVRGSEAEKPARDAAAETSPPIAPKAAPPADASPPDDAQPARPTMAAEPPPPSQEAPRKPSQPTVRMGVEAFLVFESPLPPPAQSPQEIPALLAWMLEQDPIIPNNMPRLEAIHARVFREQAAARLGYEQHLLLQIADDLWLNGSRESLDSHLIRLVAAYRRAAEAYHRGENGPTEEASLALWQMASLASRLRIEGWVFLSRHRISPRAAGADRRVGSSTNPKG